MNAVLEMATPKKDVSEDTPLTHTELRFANNYIKQGCRNQGEAWLQASGGTNIETARVTASLKMQQPNVRKFIEERQATLFKNEHMSLDELFARTARVARFDQSQMFETVGGKARLKKPEDWPEGAGELVDGVNFTKNTLAPSRMAAFQLLGRWGGADKSTMDVNVSNPIEPLEAALSRVKERVAERNEPKEYGQESDES